MAAKFPDPFRFFRFNTFGYLLECQQLEPTGGKLAGKGKAIDIRVHALTMQPPDPARWIEAFERQTARARCA